MRKRKILVILYVLLIAIGSNSYGQAKAKGPSKLSAGFLTGYNRYYLPSTLHGYDTSYSPDNDNVNTRNDNQDDDTPFTYKDADKAIAQPRFMPFAMIGLTLKL